MGGVLVLGKIAVGRVQSRILDLENDPVRFSNRIGHVGQAEAPDAVQIIDIWHAWQHIHQASREIFGEGVKARMCRLPETGAQSLTAKQSTQDPPNEGG